MDFKIPHENNCCYTHNKISKFSGKWVITNFSYCRRKDQTVLESTKFLMETVTGQVEWKFGLKFDERNGNVSLLFIPCSPTSRYITGKISLLNSSNAEVFVRTMSEVKEDSNRVIVTISMDYLLNQANGLLPNDTLTILCQVTLFIGVVNLPMLSNYTSNTECRLQQEIGQLFEKKKFSDVILSVNGIDFAVHKAILAARSPVFAAMFEHDMLENKLNRIDITDINATVIKEMLRYIYTGKVENINNMAAELSAAANKYELLHLKAMCEEELSKNLSIDNAIDTLLFSYLHGADQLKKHVINFIIHHADPVMLTAGWKKIIQSEPYLLAEIIIAQQNLITFNK